MPHLNHPFVRLHAAGESSKPPPPPSPRPHHHSKKPDCLSRPSPRIGADGILARQPLRVTVTRRRRRERADRVCEYPPFSSLVRCACVCVITGMVTCRGKKRATSFGCKVSKKSHEHCTEYDDGPETLVSETSKHLLAGG